MESSLPVSPLSVSIETNSEPLNADTSVEFRCRVLGSRPSPTLRWELEGWNSSKLESFSFIESADGGDGNSTSSVLVLPLRTDDNHKNITCVATNPLFPNATWSKAMQLSIHRECFGAQREWNREPRIENSISIHRFSEYRKFHQGYIGRISRLLFFQISPW